MSRDAYRQPVTEACATRLPAGQFDEPLWNRTFVDHAQITVAETVGVGGRWSYHDPAGATSFGRALYTQPPVTASTGAV